MSEQKSEILFGNSRLDYDSAKEFIALGDTDVRENMIYSEKGSYGNLVNIKGIEKITNTHTLPAGTNKTIASYYDYDANGTYYLVANSNNNDCIFRINNEDDSIAKIVYSKNLYVDINYLLPKFIVKAGWIFWVTGYNASGDPIDEPMALNVEMASNYTNGSGSPAYSDITRNQLLFIKPPYINSPDVKLKYDPSVKGSSIDDKIFKFAYSYVYQRGNESVLSAHSETLLNNKILRYSYKELIDSPYENYVSITFNSGSSLVESINIYAYSYDLLSFIKIDEIDKSSPSSIYNFADTSVVSTMTNDTFYVYRYYGDKSLTYIDDSIALRYFDNVPPGAGMLEYVEDRMLFGDVTIGMEQIDLDVSITVGYNSGERFYYDPSITIAGVNNVDGTSDIVFRFNTLPFIIEKGLVVFFSNFNLNYSYTTGGGVTTNTLNIISSAFSNPFYFMAYETDNRATFLERIKDYFENEFAGNYTDAGVRTSLSVFFESNIEIRFHFTPIDACDAGSNTSSHVTTSVGYRGRNGSFNSYKTGSYYQACLFYYDDSGRTTGAYTDKNFTFYVKALAEMSASNHGYPIVTMNISHTPPLSSAYYRVGYSRMLSYDYFVQGVVVSKAIHDGKGAIRIDIPLSKYEHKEGDFIRLIKDSSGSFYTVVYTEPIIGYLGEISSTFDDYILIDQNSSMYGLLAANCVVEVLRPGYGSAGSFYEVGELMSISAPHTPSRAHTNTAVDMSDYGDVWLLFFEALTLVPSSLHLIESSDLFDYSYKEYAKAYNDGRRISKQTIFRKRLQTILYGDKLLQNTNVNDIFRFDLENDFPLLEEYGRIASMDYRGSTLYISQEQGSLSVPIYRQQYEDADGQPVMAISSQFLGGKRYLTTMFGAYYPQGVHMRENVIYGFDLFNGVYWNRTTNGMRSISGAYTDLSGDNVYKMDRYFKTKAKQIINNGKDAYNVISAWDDENDLLYVIFRDTDTDANTETIVFHEPTRAWMSFITLNNGANVSPEFIVSSGNNFYSFMGGEIYKHNSDSVNRCYFYGYQHGYKNKVIDSSIPNIIKRYVSMATHSNKPFNVDPISISPNDKYPLGMLSRIQGSRFKNEEGVFKSEFLKNMKSRSATPSVIDLVNGDDLRGRIIEFTLNGDKTLKHELFKVDVKYNYSSD